MDHKNRTNGNGASALTDAALPEKVVEVGVSPSGRPWRVYHGGFLENVLGKELAQVLKGNRIRILKAFAAAIEESENASRNGGGIWS